jgi:hypothetical protein
MLPYEKQTYNTMPPMIEIIKEKPPAKSSKNYMLFWDNFFSRLEMAALLS